MSLIMKNMTNILKILKFNNADIFEWGKELKIYKEE